MKKLKHSVLIVFILIFSLAVPGEILASPSNWADQEVKQAEEYGLVPDELDCYYQQLISREEFCELVMYLYQAVSGNKMKTPVGSDTFTDTDHPAVMQAYKLGIVQGVDKDNRTFSPDARVSRQEMAVMISRTVRLLDPQLKSSIPLKSVYLDAGLIADWALADVELLSRYDLMNGTGGGMFSPRSNTTREQSIVLIKRVYEKLTGVSSASIPATADSDINNKETIVLQESPDRVDRSIYGFDWYIYRQDYTEYMQIGVYNDEVVAFFTTANKWMDYFGLNTGMNLNDVEALLGPGTGKSGAKQYRLTDKILIVFYDTGAGNTVAGVLSIRKDFASPDSQYSLICSDLEKQIFDITNAIRVSRGYSPFIWDEAVASVARSHSRDMAKNEYFSHINLAGEDPGDRLDDAGIRWQSCGENIAGGQRNAIYAVFSWLNSPGHRENVLGDFDYLGAGASAGGTYGIYYTQNFISY